MRAVRPRPLAVARGWHAEALPKRAREVRRLSIADQPRNVAHRDRGLIGQQLRRDRHASRKQVLLKARVAALRVGALQLAR
jgi:hypothetical protein